MQQTRNLTIHISVAKYILISLHFVNSLVTIYKIGIEYRRNNSQYIVVDLSYNLLLHNNKVLGLNTYWTGPALHRRAKRIPTSELMLQNVMDPIHAAVDYSLQQSCLLNLWIAIGLR